MKAYVMILICATVSFIYQPVHAEKIKISTGEWPPWMSQSLPNNGILANILQQAFATQDIDVEFIFTSWYSTTSLLEEGKVDASFPWYDNNARKKKYLFSNPVGHSQTVFIANNNKKFQWNGDFTKLKGFTIGASAKYSYGKDFDQFEKTIGKNSVLRINTAQPDFYNLMKLMNGKIDLFPVDIDVANYLLQTFFPAEKRSAVKYDPTILQEKSLHLISLRTVNSGKLITQLNSGLKALGRESIEATIEAARIVQQLQIPTDHSEISQHSPLKPSDPIMENITTF